jgi:hypothetical protein
MISGEFYLDAIGHERLPAAGGDVVVIRLAGKTDFTEPDPEMLEMENTLVPSRHYRVTFEEVT